MVSAPSWSSSAVRAGRGVEAAAGGDVGKASGVLASLRGAADGEDRVCGYLCFSGEVPRSAGDVLMKGWGKARGDGRELVGLKALTADENCVALNSCVARRIDPCTLFWKGFTGPTGVSGGGAMAGRLGVVASSFCDSRWSRQLPRRTLRSTMTGDMSESCEVGRGSSGLRGPKLTAPVSSSRSVKGPSSWKEAPRALEGRCSACRSVS